MNKDVLKGLKDPSNNKLLTLAKSFSDGKVSFSKEDIRKDMDVTKPKILQMAYKIDKLTAQEIVDCLNGNASEFRLNFEDAQKLRLLNGVQIDTIQQYLSDAPTFTNVLEQNVPNRQVVNENLEPTQALEDASLGGTNPQDGLPQDSQIPATKVTKAPDVEKYIDTVVSSAPKPSSTVWINEGPLTETQVYLDGLGPEEFEAEMKLREGVNYAETVVGDDFREIQDLEGHDPNFLNVLGEPTHPNGLPPTRIEASPFGNAHEQLEKTATYDQAPLQSEHNSAGPATNATLFNTEPGTFDPELAEELATTTVSSEIPETVIGTSPLLTSSNKRFLSDLELDKLFPHATDKAVPPTVSLEQSPLESSFDAFAVTKTGDEVKQALDEQQQKPVSNLPMSNDEFNQMMREMISRMKLEQKKAPNIDTKPEISQPPTIEGVEPVTSEKQASPEAPKYAEIYTVDELNKMHSEWASDATLLEKELNDIDSINLEEGLAEIKANLLDKMFDPTISNEEALELSEIYNELNEHGTVENGPTFSLEHTNSGVTFELVEVEEPDVTIEADPFDRISF